MADNQKASRKVIASKRAYEAMAMISTFTGYSLISGDLARTLANTVKQPVIQRECDYYRSRIGSVKSADEFVSDARLINFAMTAFGLKDMAYAKGFIRKILKEGHDDQAAFVNKLADRRYLEFSLTFDFKRYGAATTSFQSVQGGVVDKYIRQSLETQAGSENEGVRLALYFQNHAAKIGSVTEILADKALSQVIKTTLRLPSVFSLVDIDKQIATLERRLNLDDFKNPVKLEQFIKRFTALWDVDNRSAADTMTGPLFGQGKSFGISESVMASLTKIKTKI